MTPTPRPRAVRETMRDGSVAALEHPEWRERFPWLTQGVTTRGGEGPFDLGLWTTSPSREVQGRWAELRVAVGCEALVHAHQVHEAAVRTWDAVPAGLHLGPPCDGHATAARGVALAVTVADCVPVSLVDPVRRCVALLHAGWRGVAAGILGEGVRVLVDRFGTRPSDLVAHFGPSICGRCYEVGPEVHRGLGRPDPGGPAPVDLHEVLAGQALRLGLASEALTASEWCTRCDNDHLFSHRAGDPGRQVAWLGPLT